MAATTVRRASHRALPGFGRHNGGHSRGNAATTVAGGSLQRQSPRTSINGPFIVGPKWATSPGVGLPGTRYTRTSPVHPEPRPSTYLLTERSCMTAKVPTGLRSASVRILWRIWPFSPSSAVFLKWCRSGIRPQALRIDPPRSLRRSR